MSWKFYRHRAIADSQLGLESYRKLLFNPTNSTTLTLLSRWEDPVATVIFLDFSVSVSRWIDLGLLLILLSFCIWNYILSRLAYDPEDSFYSSTWYNIKPSKIRSINNIKYDYFRILISRMEYFVLDKAVQSLIEYAWFF